MSEAFHTPHGLTLFDPEAQTRRELAQVPTPRTRSSRGGFSLVELLVVIAIIIILVGLALAGINIANLRAEEGGVKAMLGSLAGVEKEYRAQTGQQVLKANGKAPNGDLDSDAADTFLGIVQDNSQVAADLLHRIQSQFLTLAGTRITAVKDPWGTAIRYHDGSGDAGGAAVRGMPKSTYPFFASAGPDGGFGRWNTTNNTPATSGTDWDADSNGTPDAQDNLYSFEVK